ncbi:hypothetical protein SAMN02745751_00104 [Dethiosulfatibacter aminovorans DSM 17477]|uniref:Uncharacterized protein n=1 Tax=Dethiosulfatibacter aminovorans DSM 17477 TaxID=1121476 RepID=A0A1M6AG57_9FIRM|nr:hypothetical protein [Dethiosulfatibacter aminovorans]SHI35278.1 hypothetical protein SAMN02745751_00104 [Dethiosulfatibacter aminovorans DSM 17477]
MKKVMVLVIVVVFVLGVASIANERPQKNTDMVLNEPDEFGNVMTIDNDEVRVVESPTEDGIITVKYYKKTGAFEIIDADGESTVIDKSAGEKQVTGKKEPGLDKD